MTVDDVTITPLIIPTSLEAPDAGDFRAFGELNRLVCDDETGLPDLAPTAAQMLPSWQDSTDSLRRGFVARRGEDIVGMVTSTYAQEEGSRAAEFDILVRTVHTGTGVAERLLAVAEDDAREHGRDVLQTWTLHRAITTENMLVPRTGWGAIPRTPLAALLERNGYALEQVERNSELDLQGDRAPLERALADALAVAGSDYRLVVWELPTPPALRDGYAEVLSRLVTDAPSGGMEFDAETWDAARVVRRDARMTSAGQLVSVAAVEHVPSGALVAYNELVIGEDRSGVTHQFGTLVSADHRGHRLGMVVKCANLLRWREAAPLSPRVSTFNAEENRPMLAINEALGFRAVSYGAAWQKRA